MSLQSRTEEAVKTVTSNFTGISFGTLEDRGTWIIRFTPAATPEEKDAANAIILTVPEADPIEDVPALQARKSSNSLEALERAVGAGDTQAALRRILEFLKEKP